MLLVRSQPHYRLSYSVSQCENHWGGCSGFTGKLKINRDLGRHMHRLSTTRVLWCYMGVLRTTRMAVMAAGVGWWQFRCCGGYRDRSKLIRVLWWLQGWAEDHQRYVMATMVSWGPTECWDDHWSSGLKLTSGTLLNLVIHWYRGELKTTRLAEMATGEAWRSSECCGGYRDMLMTSRVDVIANWVSWGPTMCL